ncbi:signal recognition particle-docking protein FtsY [Candidatus Pacearchaeota archaeon]|nr:signal recognition particle-docking protein FtsY [Candidatus Pacearchaeota archaeon]
MLGFLKDKIKGAIKNVTDRFDKEAEVVETKLPEEPKIKEKPKEKVKETKKEVAKEKPKEEPKVKEKPRDLVKEVAKEKPNFFGKISQAITTKKISESQYDELFWELEVELLENNVAFGVIEKIKNDLKPRLVDVPINRSKVEETIEGSLRESISELLSFENIDLIKEIKSNKEKPYVIVFLGTNGSGKTTTIAKVAHYLKNNNITCILAAADTFRAAAIQQLEEHGKKLSLKVIKQDYGADPAAVCFDAVSHAKSQHIDCVLIDTSGRLHSNKDLMRELEKIIRIAKPNLKILVSESITGNDAVEQALQFNEAIGLDAVILTKSDIDEKGGTIISFSYMTKKPILFLGMGQKYDDLKVPDKKEILKTLGF